MTSSTQAGMPSRIVTPFSPGVERTASTTRPRIAMPKTLNSARPTSLSIMNGYASTAASWALSSSRDGSRLARASTPGNVAPAAVVQAVGRAGGM